MKESNTPKEMSFGKLLQELATAAEIPQLANQHDHAQIEVDGVYFTVIDSEAQGAGSISYFCDFGAIPQGADRADILQRLLEANLLMFGVGAPNFAVNFETQHALLVGQAHLSEIDGQRLLNAFAQYAAQARLWQQNHYLEGQIKQPGGKSGGSQQSRLRAVMEG